MAYIGHEGTGIDNSRFRIVARIALRWNGKAPLLLLSLCLPNSLKLSKPSYIVDYYLSKLFPTNALVCLLHTRSSGLLLEDEGCRQDHV